MATLTVAGRAVVRGRVTVPLIGPWHAEVRLDADAPPSGAVTLSWGNGAASWQGSVLPARAGVYAEGGPVQVWLVGGAGGLTRTVPGESFRNATPRAILSRILADAGERLSGTSPGAVLDQNLPRWSRAAGPAGAQVGRLCEALGVPWRVLPDGTVYVGPTPSPALDLGKDGAVTRRLPAAAAVEVSVATPWTLAVGATLDGVPIEQIVHHLSPERIRSTLWRTA